MRTSIPARCLTLAALAAGLAGGLATARPAAAAGCSEIIVPLSVPLGAPASSLLARVQGNFHVSGIFRYNNTTKRFDALYFADSSAPVDASTVNPGQSVFICGTGSGSFVLAP